MTENNIYRVRSVNFGANTGQTTWVRAESRGRAENFVRERYSRHMVETAVSRTPPTDAEVHDITGDRDD